MTSPYRTPAPEQVEQAERYFRALREFVARKIANLVGARDHFTWTPWCCVCKRLVDRCEWNDDLIREERIRTVRCHGLRETVVFTDTTLDRLTRRELVRVVGLAFAEANG